MDNIAIITLMRKGSRRFPNKCMAPLLGKPLFVHTVEIALQLGYPYYLFHDYDDLSLESYFSKKDIKRINIIKRDPEFAGDMHKTNKEIRQSKIDADTYILLQATNPIRNIELLKKWVKEFIDKGAECGIACKKFENKYFYIDKMIPVNFSRYGRTDNGCARDIVLMETGNFYIFKKCMLEKQHLTITDKLIWFDDPYVCDIDSPEDLKDAEKILQ